MACYKEDPTMFTYHPPHGREEEEVRIELQFDGIRWALGLGGGGTVRLLLASFSGIHLHSRVIHVFI